MAICDQETANFPRAAAGTFVNKIVNFVPAGYFAADQTFCGWVFEIAGSVRFLNNTTSKHK